MNNKNTDKQIELYKKELEKNLDNYLKVKYPEIIWEAMRYSVLDGGKRIRPIITLEICKTLSGEYKKAIPAACAVEMLHVHSLIHDDLPCMDNDDFRRGKPSCHKAFPEAIAVLAGDALISYGVQIIMQKTSSSVDRGVLFKLVDEYVLTAGANALIAGQVVDIESENKKVDLDTLKYIYKNKTGMLFRYAFRAGALLADSKGEQLEAVTEIADKIGLAFQISDDILDVTSTKEILGKTPEKDLKSKKATYVSTFGMEETMAQLKYLCGSACDIMLKNNINSKVLLSIINSICERVKQPDDL